MLTMLRKGAQTWVAAVFIFLLAGSFAVWGIADIFGGGRFADVATIGDQKITQQAYRQVYNAESQRMSQRYGRALSRDQMRLLGVDQRVLGQLLGTAALDMHSTELNLGISDDAVAARIKRDPAFQSIGGGFDRERYQATLRNAGFSQQAFIARQRQGLLREQLTKTVTGDVAVPKTLLDAVNLFQNETRAVEYFSITPAVTPPASELNDVDVRAYYDANKTKYTAPAYREVDLIVLQPKDFRDKVEITDADVKEAFEARSSEFNTPEKRSVQQITFPDTEAATKAHAELVAGKTFDKLADEVGRADRFIDYGSVDTAGILDKEISKIAFGLEKGKYSAPIKGALSTAIVLVSDIAPAVSKTFDSVKEQVRNDLVTEKATGRVADLFDDIEDDRAKGLRIADSAGKRGLSPIAVKAIDAQGRGPDGKPVASVPSNQRLTQAISSGEIDIQNEPVELSEDSFAWYEVRSITAEKLKPFETVKDDVKKDLVEANKGIAVAKLARELVAKLKSGASVADVAKDVKAAGSDTGREVKNATDLKRSTRSDDLPTGAIGQIFAMAKGNAGSAAQGGGSRRVIFKLTNVNSPPAQDETERTSVQQSLVSQIGQDMVAQYLADLQSRYEVNINQQALQQATDPSAQSYGGGSPY